MSGNWFDLDLPKDLLMEQHSWDRRHRIARAVEAGAAPREIAVRAGVSLAAVKRFVDRAQFERRRGRISPLERHYKTLVPLMVKHIPRNASFALDVMSGRRDWLIP